MTDDTPDKDISLLREALEAVVEAADDMTQFLIHCDPAKMGEGAWREEHQVLAVRQENAFSKARAALSATAPKP